MMTESGMISLTTFNHAITADIYIQDQDLKEDKKLTRLDSRNFSFVFYYPSLIDLLIDTNMESRKFFVKVINHDETKSSRFSLTYTFDRNPIQLTEGAGIFVPNNFPLYFVYKHLHSKLFNWNIKTEHTEFEAFL